jgi:hypothetical protein
MARTPLQATRSKGAEMILGGGVFLIVVGAILAFAVNDAWDAVDLEVIGYICMGAGVLAIIISLVVNAQNRTRRVEYDVREDPAPPAP